MSLILGEALYRALALHFPAATWREPEEGGWQIYINKRVNLAPRSRGSGVLRVSLDGAAIATQRWALPVEVRSRTRGSACGQRRVAVTVRVSDETQLRAVSGLRVALRSRDPEILLVACDGDVSISVDEWYRDLGHQEMIAALALCRGLIDASPAGDPSIQAVAAAGIDVPVVEWHDSSLAVSEIVDRILTAPSGGAGDRADDWAEMMALLNRVAAS